eukprot:TRINITY_DN67250_c2_g5_i1.p1 TRINITY_DN67250_c2_g5~~TRINITY_DN67250_c2_g5_i1.p1  ORF type:complete len:279 (+),score=15.63 TRINITY_DN67250_c2_g5_i1:65-901(+)
MCSVSTVEHVELEPKKELFREQCYTIRGQVQDKHHSVKPWTEIDVHINLFVVVPAGYTREDEKERNHEVKYPTALGVGGAVHKDRYSVLADLQVYEHGWISAYVLVPKEYQAIVYFFDERRGASLLRSACKLLLQTYPVEGGKLHLFGGSNGAMSSFQLMQTKPDWVASLHAFGGSIDASIDENGEIAPPFEVPPVGIPMFLHMGTTDNVELKGSWIDKMAYVGKQLANADYKPAARLTWYTGHGHSDVCDASTSGLLAKPALLRELEEGRKGANELN